MVLFWKRYNFTTVIWLYFNTILHCCQVVPSPGGNVWTTVPAGVPSPGTMVSNDNGNRSTPGNMVGNGNGMATVPPGRPTSEAMAGNENGIDPQPYRYQQPQYQEPQYQQAQYHHPQLPQASAYNAHCPPIDNLWKASNSSSSEMVLPPHDVFTNRTGSSSSAMDDDSRKYRKTVLGLGPRLAAAICMITVLTLAAIVVCIVISQETLRWHYHASDCRHNLLCWRMTLSHILSRDNCCSEWHSRLNRQYNNYGITGT